METTSECSIDLRGGGEWIGLRRQWIVTSLNQKTGMKFRHTNFNILKSREQNYFGIIFILNRLLIIRAKHFEIKTVDHVVHKCSSYIAFLQ